MTLSKEAMTKQQLDKLADELGLEQVEDKYTVSKGDGRLDVYIDTENDYYTGSKLVVDIYTDSKPDGYPEATIKVSIYYSTVEELEQELPRLIKEIGKESSSYALVHDSRGTIKVEDRSFDIYQKAVMVTGQGRKIYRHPNPDILINEVALLIQNSLTQGSYRQLFRPLVIQVASLMLNHKGYRAKVSADAFSLEKEVGVSGNKKLIIDLNYDLFSLVIVDGEVTSTLSSIHGWMVRDTFIKLLPWITEKNEGIRVEIV